MQTGCSSVAGTEPVFGRRLPNIGPYRCSSSSMLLSEPRGIGDSLVGMTWYWGCAWAAAPTGPPGPWRAGISRRAQRQGVAAALLGLQAAPHAFRDKCRSRSVGCEPFRPKPRPATRPLRAATAVVL